MRALALLLLALPAFAEDQPVKLEDVAFDCGAGTCTIVKSHLGWLIKKHMEMTEKIEQEKKTVECAKTEVTEPAKKLPPIKMEADS